MNAGTIAVVASSEENGNISDYCLTATQIGLINAYGCYVETTKAGMFIKEIQYGDFAWRAFGSSYLSKNHCMTQSNLYK